MNSYELKALNKLAQHLDDTINVHTQRVQENIQFKDRLNFVVFTRGDHPNNTPANHINEKIYIILAANKETTKYTILVKKNGPFDKEPAEAMGLKLAFYSDTEEDTKQLANFINTNL